MMKTEDKAVLVPNNLFNVTYSVIPSGIKKINNIRT